ncbi:MAG: serine--tRNA ligase [Deltaproteobacteria bacterium]|nr:serine--tRNA ligase [Deltaproteobacteria bacterium]
MIDIKLIRQDIDTVRKSIHDRKARVDLEEIQALDSSRRDILFEIDNLKMKRNENSAAVGKGNLAPDEKGKLITQTKELGEKIKQGDQKIRELEEAISGKMQLIPNILNESTPLGDSEEDNPEIRRFGEPRIFDFPVMDHADIGTALDLLDFPRGVKLAQSRFTLLKGAGARLERALINFMLDTHTGQNGYQEIFPPLLVNQNAMRGTGQLPKFEEDLFKTTTGLYLIPSAEVPLTNIYNDEILREEELPICFTAYTPCFRSEAGSYGKDTKGYIRQHQFNKVELVKFAHPDQSFDELEKLVRNAEMILELLELPYRVISLCSADIGFSAAKCYDLEVWLPSENRYREISSCSNCTDFQARRANIRFKPKEGGKNRFVHTLNGSGLAVGRTLAAILENYQTKEGGLIVPKVLVPYMGGLTEILRNH